MEFTTTQRDALLKAMQANVSKGFFISTEEDFNQPQCTCANTPAHPEGKIHDYLFANDGSTKS